MLPSQSHSLPVPLHRSAEQPLLLVSEVGYLAAPAGNGLGGMLLGLVEGQLEPFEAIRQFSLESQHPGFCNTVLCQDVIRHCAILNYSSSIFCYRLIHSAFSSNPPASPARGWGSLQPSKIPAQLAHISLPWGRELTLLCITNESDGSQATCAILPALSEVLLCHFQCPLLCAIFLVSFLCLLVLSIFQLHPRQ